MTARLKVRSQAIALPVREVIVTMNEITKAEMRKRLGNISQLQDLLFGEQIDEYNCQIEQHNRQLDRLKTNLQKFQLVTEERIEQLENKLSQKIDSLANSFEKKLKYLNFTSQEKYQKVQYELDSLSKHSYENLDLLQNCLNANTNSLRAEINQSKSAVDRDLQLLKQQILDKLEFNLATLSTDKVSRGDLAEVLFELCLKLKGKDVNLDLPEGDRDSQSSEKDVGTDFMLPETK